MWCRGKIRGNCEVGCFAYTCRGLSASVYNQIHHRFINDLFPAVKLLLLIATCIRVEGVDG